MTEEQRLLQGILDELKAAGGSGGSGGSSRPRRRGGPADISGDDFGGATARDNALEANIAERKEEIKSLEAAYSSLYRSIDRGNEIKKQKLEIDKLEALRRDESTEQIQRSINALEHQKAASEDVARKLQSALGLGQGQVSKQLTDIGQHLNNVNVELGGGIEGAKGMAQALSAGLGATLMRTVLKPIEMLVEQTIGLAKAQDKAISSFRKATGATAEYNYEITQLERRNYIAGVSIEEAGKAFEGLFTSFSAFTELSKNERAAIGDTVALLGELDVSAQVSGKIIDQTFRGLGMSIEQSNDLLLDLAGSAQDLGVPISKMTADFSSAFGELSKYGDEAIEVFKELSIVSKSTGIEVSRLMQISKQFDTFEGSAKSVGRLNAILGGPYLNSIDMLNASEEDRIRIMKEQVDVSGVQFNALERFEKQAIASALGVSVEEAGRILNMSEEQYKLDAAKQEELQELARETQEIGQELKSAFMALAVDLRPLVDDLIKPLIKGFAAVARGIGTVINSLGTFGKVGLMAAAIAALIAAPFTGGGSLILFAKLAAVIGGAGILAGVAGVGAQSATTGGQGGSAPITPGFAQGGTITTQQAAVHPGELIMTGAQGSEVISQNKFNELIDAVKGNQGSPQQIAVYIGQEKIDELIIKGINSPAGQAAFAPFGNG